MDTYPHNLDEFEKDNRVIDLEEFEDLSNDNHFEDSRIKLIKKKLRKFFECDPWTCEDNPDFDPQYTQNELIEDIVEICRD